MQLGFAMLEVGGVREAHRMTVLAKRLGGGREPEVERGRAGAPRVSSKPVRRIGAGPCQLWCTGEKSFVAMAR